MSEDLKQLSDNELVEAIAKLQEASRRYSAALDEQNRRDIAAFKKEAEEKKQAFLKSDKFKKLAVRYREVLQRIKNLPSGKQILTLDIPVTFTFKSETDADFTGPFQCWPLDNVFVKTRVEGKIDKTANLTKQQRVLLQSGLNNIISDACNEIYDLFALTEEQEDARAEMKKVIRAGENFGLTFEDFEVSA